MIGSQIRATNRATNLNMS